MRPLTDHEIHSRGLDIATAQAAASEFSVPLGTVNADARRTVIPGEIIAKAVEPIVGGLPGLGETPNTEAQARQLITDEIEASCEVTAMNASWAPPTTSATSAPPPAPRAPAQPRVPVEAIAPPPVPSVELPSLPAFDTIMPSTSANAVPAVADSAAPALPAPPPPDQLAQTDGTAESRSFLNPPARVPQPAAAASEAPSEPPAWPAGLALASGLLSGVWAWRRRVLA